MHIRRAPPPRPSSFHDGGEKVPGWCGITSALDRTQFYAEDRTGRRACQPCWSPPDVEGLCADGHVRRREPLGDFDTAVYLHAFAGMHHIVPAPSPGVASSRFCSPVDYFLGKLRGLRDLQALINLPSVCRQGGGKSDAAEEAINHTSSD